MRQRIEYVEMMLLGMNKASGDVHLLCLDHGLSSSHSPRTGTHWDGVTCPACLKNKAGRLSLPLLSSAMFIGHDEFQLCRGQLRPAEQLSADAQTLLPQQKRSPHPFGASLYEESSLVHTQSRQLCFSSGLRENQE